MHHNICANVSNALPNSLGTHSVVTVECPEMGESISEGTFVSIVKTSGEAVAVDDVVAQIETNKVTLDVRSPYNGALTEYLVSQAT